MKYVFVRYKYIGGYDDNGEEINDTKINYYSHNSNTWQLHILDGRISHFLFDNCDSPPNGDGVFELFDENKMITYYHEVEGQLVGHMDNKKH